jgi:hypothetical protein
MVFEKLPAHLLRLLLQLAYLRALRVQRHLHLQPRAQHTTTRRLPAVINSNSEAPPPLTRNISRFFAMNSLVFSRSRLTGGRVVGAAASLLRMGALTSARESMDFTNSADA